MIVALAWADDRWASDILEDLPEWHPTMTVADQVRHWLTPKLTAGAGPESRRDRS